MSDLVALGKEADEEDFRIDETEFGELQVPLAFVKKRHLERIEGTKTLTQTWRMKERMKTVSVALVLCLNVGVDPPDVVKTQPCARLECWIDPTSLSPHKALESIGASLQRQYERWQPRARYKQSLDPTVEEVKKLCTSLRRNARDERVLFHYNGHGVPKPTVNGEIWVFNKTYTQYIPLSVYDLQTWMGSPSIYVYDCSNAAIIVDSFKQFSHQREQEHELASLNSGQRYGVSAPSMSPPSVKNCIQLAACSAMELLPMTPELPADLFTSCLTTPIKIALRWFVLESTSKLVPNITLELLDKIPGQLNDRRTMLGELNWIFTAITDTIAWNTLPRELFQKLFRQDLLVASLFRNFLLAERIMRSYNCTPVSSPKLPSTYQHPMWHAWDLALDLCLSQLNGILEEGKAFQHSPFFAEQLTAFQVWLSYGCQERSPPEQLPIVLQVLLSQVHRLRALELLGRFLDLGPWAVNLALSVGIFPYVLKLLQSSARELRPLLVFIWAKILAVDSSCQADLVKDNGHKYFLSVLADQFMPAEHRTMAAFVLAMIVNSYQQGRFAALQGNLISICLEQLNDPHHLLRQWLALCLAKVWTKFDDARWCGVRDSAHEKLYKLLDDPIPEVRASAVHALGTFINITTERNEHANNIDHAVAMKLINNAQDGSPIVRKELVVALSGLIQQFETQFVAVAYQFIEEERQAAGMVSGGWNLVPAGTDTAAFGPPTMTTLSGMRRSASSRILRDLLSPTSSSSTLAPNMNTSLGGSTENLSVTASRDMTQQSPIKRVTSTSSIPGFLVGSYGNVYVNIWRTLLQMSSDPCPDVADLATKVVSTIKNKAVTSALPKSFIRRPQNTSSSHSAPNSPSNKPSIPQEHLPKMGETPPKNEGDRMPTFRIAGDSASRGQSSHHTGTGSPHPSHSSQYLRSKKKFDKVPAVIDEKDEEEGQSEPVICTEFFEWSCKHFAQSVSRLPNEHDPESMSHHRQEYRLLRARKARREAVEEQRRAGFSRLDDQIFLNRNQNVATVVRFHPYIYHLAVSDKDSVTVWDWEQYTKLGTFHNQNPKHTHITAMEFVNAHDNALLLTGSDDGAVRVWRNYCNEVGRPLELVTAWQALSDMLPGNRGSGLVLDWEQTTGILYASGDVRTIRVWDTQREHKVQDLGTGADSCVTSLTCDTLGQSVLIASCGDGSIRVFDRRAPPHECLVMTLREHSGWVVKVHLDQSGAEKLISAGSAGDVRFWDRRKGESFNVINVMNHGLTAFDVHHHADVLACGSVHQFVSVLNQSGDLLSTIKYYDGFMGQRIGSVTSLAFHPYKVKLAVSSTDSFVSVYSSTDYRRR